MPGDLLNQPLGLDGLRQVRFEATPERAVTGRGVVEGGDRDRRAWPRRSLCQELEAVEAGQLQINYEHIGRLGVEYKQGAFGIFDHRDDRSGLGELPREIYLVASSSSTTSTLILWRDGKAASGTGETLAKLCRASMLRDT